MPRQRKTTRIPSRYEHIIESNLKFIVLFVLKEFGMEVIENSIRVLPEHMNRKIFGMKRLDFHLSFPWYDGRRKTMIEYDGQQHFKPGEYKGGKRSEVIATKKRDKIKQDAALANGYSVIRIDDDFKTEAEICEQLEQGLRAVISGYDIYYSNPQKYKHLN